MNNLTTGIVVVIALLVVGTFFIFPSLSPFGSAAPATPGSTTGATSTNELQIMDTTPGTGRAAAAGDTLTIDYVGAFEDGTVFDSSAAHGQHLTFTLGAGNLIAGLDQGLVGMKEGGIRKLVIPPELAYGSTGAGGGIIPPNTTLVFTVTLLTVTPAAQ